LPSLYALALMFPPKLSSHTPFGLVLQVVPRERKHRLSSGRRSGRQKYTDHVLEQARAKSAVVTQLRKKASVAIGR
jgi:hypothetical protein